MFIKIAVIKAAASLLALVGTIIKYSKTCVIRPLSKRRKIVFHNQLSLNVGQKYCRMLPILQYFRPSLSYHLSSRSLFCLFLSGRFTQVLLYCVTPFLPNFMCVLLLSVSQTSLKMIAHVLFKIKRCDWLLADTCPQAANHCT